MQKNERLRSARENAGFASAAEAARAMDVSVPTYSAHENGGRDFSVKAAQLYARRFNVPVEWLILGQEKPKRNIDFFQKTSAGLPYAGIVEAGAFRETDDDIVQDTGEEGEFGVKRVNVDRDWRYPKARQYAYEIRGDSMDLAGFMEGMYATVADYSEFVDHYGHLTAGDYVVVERHLNGGHARELTIKKVGLRPGLIDLIPESSNRKHKTFSIPVDHDADNGTEIVIKGIVLKVTKLCRQP